MNKKKIAKNTYLFTFKRPKNFDFIAGQYVSVFIPGKNDSRDFTICSSPHQKNFFSFVTKEGKSDFKKELFSLLNGSVISVVKPSGGFLLTKSAMPKVFLAGGIGITPFYSMISYASEEGMQVSLVLIASFSKKEDICFYGELVSIAKKNKNIKIIYTLSQEKLFENSGRISKELVGKYISDVSIPEFYIAGGVEMVEDTEKLLLQMGIDSSKIKVDIFTGY